MTHQVEVAILIDGAWVDICGPGDVLGRDRVRITRGRPDWASRVTYSKATMSLKNADGTYSPRNPLSPYYGKLGRNTPLRVSVDGRVRFLGEVAEWPQRADPDVHVPIEAAGVLRRLSERKDQLKSVMRRTLLEQGELQTPVAYWPCEDGSGSTALWSALANRRPMTISEGISLAAYDGFASSDPIPILNNTQFYGNVRAYSGSTVSVMCLVHFDDDAFAADGLSFMVANGSGTGAYWRVQVNINRTVRLQVADEDGATITTSSNSSWTVGSAGALVVLRLTQDGSDVDWEIRKYEPPSPRFAGFVAVPVHSGTVTSRTVGRVTRITIGSSFSLGQTAVGHVALYQDTLDDSVLWSAVDAYIGEPAGRRVERLCLEEGVPLAVVGDLDDTQSMGPQRARTLTDLLDEASDVDGGILYEPTHVNTVLGDWEDGTDQGWEGSGTDPPTVAFSSVRFHSGGGSLLVTWVGGSNDQIAHVAQPNRYVIGTTYTARVWVWVPAGSTAVALVVGGVAVGPSSSVTDAWEELEYTWTCTASDNEVQVWAVTPAGVGAQVWLDDVSVSTDKPGLAYRTRRSMYNVDSTLTLDFDQNQVALPFEPVDDDQLLRQFGNSVTVTREDGGSSTRTIDTGPMSIQDPPDGVGLYVGSGGTFNVETDDATALLAAWRAFLGTWDEQRYPQLSVNLRRHPTLADDAAATDLGHRITVVNPPEWLPPDVIEQQVQGYEETLDTEHWMIQFNCTPWGPFRAPTIGNARLDSLYSTLDADIDADDTSMDVAVETGRAAWIQSAEKPTSFPLLILVGGEEMSVSAIGAPVSGVQTFTVVRSVNGIVKSHDAGTQVRVKDKAYVTW
jgi:hypothetical protein